MLATTASWWDYRKEEATLVDTAVERGLRTRPRLSGFWRWTETWFILLVVVVWVVVRHFTFDELLPLIG